MRFFPHLLLWCVLCGVTPLSAATQIYRYTDDAGTLTFTTELHSIPEQYRGRAVPLYGETTATAGSVTPAPPQNQPESMTRVVRVTSDYRMGAYDTRTDAIRMAVESAKRQALEQVATYLESVTEVRNLDLTRDELRTYSAGSVMVLDQQTSTKMEDGAVVIHVDLTAQVDRNEVIREIMALRDNESAKQQLVALRTETDQLRQQLDAANQALATAQSPEQIQALLAERQHVLDQMQADAMASEARTAGIYPYPMIGGLIFQPRSVPNRHPHALQRPFGPSAAAPPSPPPGEFPSAAAQTRLREAIALPAPPVIPRFPQIQPLGVPHGSVAETPVIPTFPQIQPQGVPYGSLSQSPTPSLSPSPLAAPLLQPTFPQIQPLGVPHGSLSPAPLQGHHHSGETAGHVSGESHGGGHGH